MALALAEQPKCCKAPSSEASLTYTLFPKSLLPVYSLCRRSVRMATFCGSSSSPSRTPPDGSIHGFASPNNAYTPPNAQIMTGEQLWQVSPRPRDASAESMAPLTTSAAASPRPATVPVDTAFAISIKETRTGVDWDAAMTALLLLSRACARAQQPDTKPENTRALVVDASKWILQSLPEQLAAQELEEMEEVLPVELDDANRKMRRRTRGKRRFPRPERRPWLRRAVAFTILQLSLLVAFIIPYVTVLVNSCYRFERRHHTIERFLAGSIDMTNLVGESAMGLTDAVFRLRQGRLVDGVLKTMGWLFESIIGGVSDGAGKGLAIVGEAVLSREGQQADQKEGGEDMGSRPKMHTR